jgi:hypothetical protein
VSSKNTDSPHWRLRLSCDKEWQKQYTGFDPRLVLPKEFSDYHAMGFLTADARFMDALLPMRDKLKKMDRYFIDNSDYLETKNIPQGIRTRAFYNISLADVESARLHYLASYMHEKSKNSISGKIHFHSDNPYRALVERFRDKIKTHRDCLSAREFMDYLTEHVKPQYIEPWLLYRGQAIKELREVANSLPEFPAEHKATIEAVWNAYHESGLSTHVDRVRKWGNSPLAQAERRTKVEKDLGPPRGVAYVGALDTGVRIAPKATPLGREA